MLTDLEAPAVDQQELFSNFRLHRVVFMSAGITATVVGLLQLQAASLAASVNDVSATEFHTAVLHATRRQSSQHSNVYSLCFSAREICLLRGRKPCALASLLG